jgi:hypothetical protein
MKKILASISTLAIAAVGFTAQAAPSYELQPGVYDPGNLGHVEAYITPDKSLHLEKNASTTEDSAAGANIDGVAGLSTTGLTLGFTLEEGSYCGAGAPRFNVYLSNGDVIFLGCIYGDPDNDGTVIFEAGNTYGGVLFPEGETVEYIQIIQDEEGQAVLSDITVNGEVVHASMVTLTDQCKKGGYEALGYANQGQCVSAFANGK